GQGFLRSLVEEGGYLPEGQRALILGAGGAARAVAWTLAGAGIAELLILNRTVARAESLADAIARGGGSSAGALAPGDPRTAARIAGCTLVVNATSIGLDPKDRLPIDPILLRPGMLVYDLVYRPRETSLLREAKRRGCRVQDGLGMLVHQGALAFELWTGRHPPLEAMRAALVAALA
ncbi:MAG: shikimate dehydrogenase family protein, partial [bacterium]